MLFVSFPAPHVFKCPEEGCSAAYTAAAWTAKRQSLQRHLEGDHGMRIRRTVNLCTLCGATLGTRPTSHPCLANGRAAAQPTQQRYQCNKCPQSFPSRKGLHNHLQWHGKEEAKQLRAASSQASTTPTEEAQQPPATPAASAVSSEPGELDQQPPPCTSPVHGADSEQSRRLATPTPEDQSTKGTLASSPIIQATGETPSALAESPSASSQASTTPMEEAQQPPATPAASAVSGEPKTLEQQPLPCTSPVRGDGSEESRLLGTPTPEDYNTRATLASTPITQATGETPSTLAESPMDAMATPSRLFTQDCPSQGGSLQNSDQQEDAVETAPAKLEDDSSVLAEHTKKLRRLLTRAPNADNWAEFGSILDDAISVIATTVKLPDATADGRPRREVNPQNAQQIQSLYRRNRRHELEAYFSTVWAPKQADTTLLTRRMPAPGELSLAAFTEDEVAARLRRCENTAPGGDRLTYHHWRTVDPEGSFLAAVFNCCLRHRRVPACWKASRTVLIHKKGEKRDPTNWRPISLGNTIAKLYAGCLASRLQGWLCDHGILSQCQKGFLPHDGVFEHNFVLQERLDAARTGGGDLCVAFLDYANAFGSVAHNALVDSVRGAGTGDAFASIIQDLYEDNTTAIISEGGTTEPVAIKAGIRQGCPLSGLLFNLVLDPVIRAVQGGQRQHKILAYADDLTPMGGSPAELQTRINVVTALSSGLGLQLNPSKCRTLHLTGRQPVGTRPTTFCIGEAEIPHMTDFEAHTFLGRPVGYRVLPDTACVDDAIALGRCLLSSMLAPWQRLDAIKTFLYPALNFAMRVGAVGKEEWRRLDDTLRPLIKRTLYLPANSSNKYLYGSAGAGVAGIPEAADISDACRIDGAFKLLSSPDSEVRDLALQAVTRVTEKRLRRPVAAEDVAAYLSGDTEGDFRATSTQLQSVWTEARKASRRAGVTWELVPEGARIACGGTTISPKHRHKVIRTLRGISTAANDRALHQQPSQGKAMECVAADRASSHFMRSGRYTRFTDWRFIHRARLNLLPLNGARPWASAVDQRCRACGYQQETLPHVVCHCMVQSQALTRRHNNIVNRIKAAATPKFTVTHENQPVGESSLRPDLVLARGEEAIIIDVTCPFDNRRAALLEARQQKIEKYEAIKQYLCRRYQRVTVAAVIVGALGSWDPDNDATLRRLCSRSYLRLMKKLIVSETIASSRDIYASHIAGKRL
ncbi:uncharacterized protein ISCGN_017106 [Ixodes scapularis]